MPRDVRGSLGRRHGRREPSTFEGLQEGMYGAVAEDAPSQLILLDSLFHGLPAIGPEIRLSGVNSDLHHRIPSFGASLA